MLWYDNDEDDEELEDKEEQPEPERRLCPYCNGTNISPYERDGGSCPHCFGGYEE